jgi:hypothetical protein
MLANGQDQLARQYYDENKKTITDGETITSVEKALKEGTLRGDSQRETDRITASYGSWSDRLAQADKITNPEVRDEVDRRLKTNMGTEKAVQQQQEEKVTQDATNIIEKFKDFDQVPPAMVQQMSPSTRKSLRGYADDLREGKKAVTNWNDYYDLKTMAATPDLRDKFLKENLISYRPNLADGELKELITLQSNMREGKGDKELDGYRTNQMIVNDTLGSVGIDATPNVSKGAGKKEMESVNNFRKMVDDQITLYQQQTNKKATNKEVQSIVDRLIIQGSVPGSGFMGLFKTQKRSFELQPGETIVPEGSTMPLGPGGIPVEEIAKIKAALVRNNIPVSDEKVMSLYLRKVRSAN